MAEGETQAVSVRDGGILDTHTGHNKNRVLPVSLVRAVSHSCPRRQGPQDDSPEDEPRPERIRRPQGQGFASPLTTRPSPLATRHSPLATRHSRPATKKGVSHLRGWETPIDEAFRIIVRTLADWTQPGANLDQFFLGTDQGSKSFGQQVGVERLLERFIDTASVEAHRLTIIGQ